MSGPTRKKMADGQAVWVNEEADEKAIAPYLDGILKGVPEIKQHPEAVNSIRVILRSFIRNREQPEKGEDHASVMKRRDALFNQLPGFLGHIEAVIQDGAPPSLKRAADALLVACVELQKNLPESCAQSEARARNAAIVALMKIAEESGVNPELVVHHSGLLKYENEDQFTRALSRAKQDFSGHN